MFVFKEYKLGNGPYLLVLIVVDTSLVKHGDFFYLLVPASLRVIIVLFNSWQWESILIARLLEGTYAHLGYQGLHVSCWALAHYRWTQHHGGLQAEGRGHLSWTSQCPERLRRQGQQLGDLQLQSAGLPFDKGSWPGPALEGWGNLLY